MSSDTAPGRQVYRLEELNRAIGRVLAAGLRDEVWVVGEISNLRERDGTRYFDLVEPGPGGGRNLAQIPAAVLRWERSGFDAEVAAVPGFRLADGVEVLVRAVVDFYVPWGRVQLKVRGIDPAHTLGRMHLAREQLLASLAERGVLRTNATCRVGQPPLRLGLVTAPDSRAEHDLRAVLAASGWGFRLLRVGARVQGPACEAEVAAALTRLADLHRREPLDVVVLIRGGGSALDLQGFDTPGIAEAIVTAPFPIWTGIGHEQDRSVADALAHTAFPTPTAVGNALVATVDGAADRLAVAADGLLAGAAAVTTLARRDLDRHRGDLAGHARAELRGARVGLVATSTALGQLARARVGREDRRLAARASGLVDVAPRATVPGATRHLAGLTADLLGAARAIPAAGQRRLELAQTRLEAADPVRVLARGYSITYDADGRVLRSVAALTPGAVLRTRLHRGEVTSAVVGEGGASGPRAAPAAPAAATPAAATPAPTHARPARPADNADPVQLTLPPTPHPETEETP